MVIPNWNGRRWLPECLASLGAQRLRPSQTIVVDNGSRDGSVEAIEQILTDAKVVGGTTGLGAVIGAIAGGKKGAAIGAVVGAGAGAGTVMATKGKELEFEPEHRFSFKLENDVEMKIRR